MHRVHSAPGVPHDLGLRWADGKDSRGSLWFDAFDAKGADVIATYTQWPNEGLAAVTSRSVGAGRIILLGTLPAPEDLRRLVQEACQSQRIVPVAKASGNLVVVPRQGGGRRGMVVVEVDNEPATLELEGPMTELTSGETRQGALELAPYTVLVLER